MYLYRPLTECISKYMKELGNDKPKLLMDIEKLIWKMVMDISRGDKDVRAALAEFLRVAPWGEIQRLSDDDPVRRWFMPSEINLASV